MARRSFRRDSSGQVLIIAGLLIALILLSTALFVIELGKDVPTATANNADNFGAYTQAAKNTLISALANRTGGGDPDVLAMDLAQLKTAITSHSYQTMLTMDYTLQDSGGYQNGLLLLWGTDGHGTSSASASFAFTSSSSSSSADAQYTTTIATQVTTSGNYTQQEGNQKEFHLTVTLSNEGKPALAQQFTITYENATDWITADSPTITSHGDGTYAVSFNAETDELAPPIIVSLQCIDQRGISVGAKVTCNSA
jgi:hypothetical protein